MGGGEARDEADPNDLKFIQNFVLDGSMLCVWDSTVLCRLLRL
jgi:hypothetical protein